MKAVIPWLAVLASMVACGGGGADNRALQDGALGHGTWTLGHNELANDCGSEGVLFPVGPAHVKIEQRADRVTLTSAGDEPRTYAVEGNRWLRERHEALGECAASLRETWQVHGLLGGHLSATYDAELELSEGCDLPNVHGCRVRYSVWGARR